jgi:hypothetical protein
MRLKRSWALLLSQVELGVQTISHVTACSTALEPAPATLGTGTRFLRCSRSHLPQLLASLPCCLAYAIGEAVVARRKWLPATRGVVFGSLRSDPRPVPWDPTGLLQPRALPAPRPSPSTAVSFPAL